MAGVGDALRVEVEDQENGREKRKESECNELLSPDALDTSRCYPGKPRARRS